MHGDLYKHRVPVKLNKMRSLWIIFVLSRVINAEDANKPPLECFVCDSATSKYCADTFHVTGVPVNSCLGGCVKTKLQGNQVYRYCVDEEVKEGCTTHRSPPSVECYCKRNLCNSATAAVVMQQTTWLITVATAFLATR